MRLLLPDSTDVDERQLLDLYDGPAEHVRGGMVLSVDGAAVHDGSSTPMSGPADRVAFRTLRSVADVLVVGAGTARAEQYGPVRLRPYAQEWRAAHGRSADVPLAVVSASLDVPPSALAGPRALVLTCAAAPADRRAALAELAEVVTVGDADVDLAAAIQVLRDRGLPRVLCEGGPGLLGDLVRAGQLTELCATVSPLLAGAAPGLLSGDLPTTVPLRLAHLLESDGELLGRWTLTAPERDA